MATKRIHLRVKPGSSKERLERITDNEFLACVNAPAQEGKANAAAIKLLSEYFDIPKSTVIIVKGEKSRDKVIDIPVK